MSTTVETFVRTLVDLENKWKPLLNSERCPPVLGLSPLADEEADLISRLAASHPRNGSPRLSALLDRYPAATVVWLARKAGEAYDGGAFWDKFSALLRTPIPLYYRPELARAFREACRRVMSTWVLPADLGAHNHVAEFLFQAGLPLERCDQFARHFRKVERNYGLPDADLPNAGEHLRDCMLSTLQATPFLTLKRALRGPAGPRICEVALAVVLNDEFGDINPRLGKELARAFEQGAGRALRRSVHQPYLRLGADLGSLEVVGPRQDAGVFSGGATWILNGRRTPTPRNEDFVDDVTTESRITLELSDRSAVSIAPQTFVLRLADREAPFMLFDERNRRERRGSGILPPGFYWALHRAQDNINEAVDRYEWADGERVVSRIEIRPGKSAVLESPERTYTFAASVSPFIESGGKKLETSNGQQLEFAWNSFPSVWMPLGYIEQDLLQRWRVNIHGVGDELEFPIVPSGELLQGMARCSIDSGDLLDKLPAGLYRLRFSLHRIASRLNERSAEFLYWKGLRTFTERTFDIAATPFNLVKPECSGFSLQEHVIAHEKDHRRRHTLRFDIAGSPTSLDWNQPGLFLEAVERRVGQRSEIEEHRLGDMFPATIDSTSWLRVWFAGWNDWELWIGDRQWQRSLPNDRRTAIDLSLANLAVSFPEGGELHFRASQLDRVVARFTSPLYPFSVEPVEDNGRQSLAFSFPKPVVGVRCSAWNFLTREKFQFDEVVASDSGQSALHCESLPPVFFATEANELPEQQSAGNELTVSTSRSGWPGGVWILEFYIQARVNAEWEPLRLRGKQHAPMTLAVPMSQATIRSLLLSEARFGAEPESMQIEETQFPEVVELMADLMELRRQDFADAVSASFSWIKDALRSVTKVVARLIRATSSDNLRAAALDLACQDPAHSGFVFLPGLLALSSSEYRELPLGDPLNEALRQCALVSTADSLSSLAKVGFFDMHFLGCFSNFAAVARQVDDQDTMDFRAFNYQNFWAEVISGPWPEAESDWARHGVLGSEHLIWALGQLSRRYHGNILGTKVGDANALLHQAAPLRQWLELRIGKTGIMPASSWRNPWPRVSSTDVDFIEAVPRFASLFALAARCSAAEMLHFEELLEWLEDKESRKRTESGIAALVTIAPELFGYFLLFWEAMVKTCVSSRFE